MINSNLETSLFNKVNCKFINNKTSILSKIHPSKQVLEQSQEIQETFFNKHALTTFASKEDQKPDLIEITQAIPSQCKISPESTTQISTDQKHKNDSSDFFGPYAEIRATLDYNYHNNYTKQRQHLQDKIISHFLGTILIQDRNGNLCTTPTEPFIVFTAGAMGAGKGHTIKMLVEQGHFPLLAFVVIDPDEIRRHFPEYKISLDECPEYAGELTHKVAGFIAEILTSVALEQGKNVLVDGSLRDSDWYQIYFQQLRERYSRLKLAIIHVTAPRETIFRRAEQRGITTGRVVLIETMTMVIEQVPRSVNILKHLVDIFVEIDNPDDGDMKITSIVIWIGHLLHHYGYRLVLVFESPCRSFQVSTFNVSFVTIHN